MSAGESVPRLSGASVAQDHDIRYLRAFCTKNSPSTFKPNHPHEESGVVSSNLLVSAPDVSYAQTVIQP
jgi:hypothetical protein